MLEISGQIMSADIPVVEIENGIVKSVNKELAPLFFLRSLDFTTWLESRACNQKCDQCDGDFSITLDDWKQIRKQTNVFTLIFEDILSKL